MVERKVPSLVDFKLRIRKRGKEQALVKLLRSHVGLSDVAGRVC